MPNILIFSANSFITFEQMSHNSLHIQEISSRTFNNDPSIMETSIDHFERPSITHFQKFQSKNSTNKNINANTEKMINELASDNQALRREIAIYQHRFAEMQKMQGGAFSQEGHILELMQEGARKDAEIRELYKNYQNALGNLKETMDKNNILSREVARLSKKLKDSDLNYSREKDMVQKSQNLISGLAITKSNYEIQLVNMQDSLIILEKERNKISQTNEQYEEKLALISQQIERLRILLEKCKKENQMLKFNLNDAGLKVKKYQSETIQQKSILQRLRTENRELNSKFSSLSLQLREHHEKLVYKETIINDSKESKAALERNLKEKELHLRNTQARLQEIERSWKAREEEFTRQANSYAQELGKVRSKLSEQNSSNKQIQRQREVLVSEQQEIIKRYGLLKEEFERNTYQIHALAEQLKNVEKERDLHMRDKQALLAENEQLSHVKEELLNELQKMKNQLLKWQEKYQDTEVTFRKYEEKQRQITREYQSKLDVLTQQKNSDLGTKNSEINQYKYQLSTRGQEIERLKDQLQNLISLAEQDRRKLEEQLRNSNEEANELKVRLSNYEKLLQQGRRERDLLLQEKSNITKSSQKIEQMVQTKNSQLRNSSSLIDQLGRTVREMKEQIMRQSAEIQSYKRVMTDNQRAITQLSDKGRQSNHRMQQLTVELERTTTLVKEKEAIIYDLGVRLRENLSSTAEKTNEINNLKLNHERMNVALGRAQEFKSNFQIFLQQIERLNQVVAGKQSEIKHLRSELAQLIHKIDGIGQEQLKIIKAVQAAYSQQVNQSQEIRLQFSDLKEYIGRINQNTTSNLKELSEQSANITSHLNRNNADHQKSRSELQAKLLEMNRTLIVKQNENHWLQEQVMNLKEKLAKQEEGLVKQQEIFVKIIQLSRQNSAVKEKLAHFSAERQLELNSKNSSIANFESQLSQLDKAQKKEIAELKLYISQKQKRMDDHKARSFEQITSLKSQLARTEQSIQQKERVITELQMRLQQVTPMIEGKMRELQMLSRELQTNSSELQRYKEMFSQKYLKARQPSHQEGTKREVEALMKIISLREEQIKQNQFAFVSLQKETIQIKKSLGEQKLLMREQALESQLQIQQLSQEKSQLYERLKEAEQALVYFERTQAQRGEGNSSQLASLLEKNANLQREIKAVYGRLRQGQSKLASAKEKIATLSRQLYEFIDSQNRSIDKLESTGLLQKEKEELMQRVSQLQDELETVNGKANELRIENEYLRESCEQSKIFLHSYQFKTAEVDKQYISLKEVYTKLTSEYSRLQLKNHEFEIELSKAQILQQKIQVLNGEINRLSQERIELREQVSSCKLALSSEVMAQRRIQQQFMLIVLLMAEVESLRSRLASQQMELKSSRIAQLSPYRQ